MKEWVRRYHLTFNPLINFWMVQNFHINKNDAEKYGIENFEKQIKELQEVGIPINQETRTDLGETEMRFWLDEKYREANR